MWRKCALVQCAYRSNDHQISAYRKSAHAIYYDLKGSCEICGVNVHIDQMIITQVLGDQAVMLCVVTLLSD
jgi:hypothetical protein